MAWRDDRLAARTALHDTFAARARFVSALPYDSNSGDSAPEITVRIHDSQKPIGESTGVNLHGAEIVEAVPKAIFLISNLEEQGVTLLRKAVISLSADEAYMLDVVMPHDHETVSCEIHRLNAEERAGLPVPE